MRIVQKFLSTPSARRATLAACAALHADAISIHALREEGDTVPSSETTSVEDFYPRPPRGGRLQPVFQGENCCLNFYPRPPRGGRREGKLTAYTRGEFLSTPSARRATPSWNAESCLSRIISIHALREEGDRNRCFRADRSADFYPRPPRGGRPVRFLLLHVQQDFYPRPPRGGRPRAAIGGDKQKEISIHALREEGDL